MSLELKKLLNIQNHVVRPVLGEESANRQLSASDATELHTFKAFRVGEIHPLDLDATKTAVKACFEVGIDPKWIAKGLENHGYQTKEDVTVQPLLPQGATTGAIQEDAETIMVYNIRTETNSRLIGNGQQAQNNAMIVFSSTAVINKPQEGEDKEKVVDFYAFSQNPLDAQGVESSPSLTAPVLIEEPQMNSGAISPEQQNAINAFILAGPVQLEDRNN